MHRKVTAELAVLTTAGLVDFEVEEGSRTSIKLQGDASFYTEDAIRARAKLEHHAGVKAEIAALWTLLVNSGLVTSSGSGEPGAVVLGGEEEAHRERRGVWE